MYWPSYTQYLLIPDRIDSRIGMVRIEVSACLRNVCMWARDSRAVPSTTSITTRPDKRSEQSKHTGNRFILLLTTSLQMKAKVCLTKQYEYRSDT